MLAAAAARRVLGPFVPARKKLPFSYWLHRLSRTCGPELSYLNEFISSTGTAIDVGANEGLFTYVLSKRFHRVHAFEVNKEVANPIAQYNPGNITLHPCGLSSSSRTARFYIPVTKGFASAGWGSLNRDNLPGAKEFIEMDVEVRPLDDFGIASVDFVKIDVEGHEIEVLKGGAKTIEQSRPIVLIEVKDDHLQSVNAWFLARNFRHYSLEEVFNLRERNANHLYVPTERMDRLGICV
jgi:FkbM family methyltransferase